MMKIIWHYLPRRILLVSCVILSFFLPVYAQDEPYPTLIDASNIAQLQSIYQLDFSQLPAEIETASGQFVMSADATRVISFGNLAGEPPFSQAIIWEDGEISGVVAIEGDSFTRELTSDGQCLYVGYQGYLKAYRLNETLTNAEYLHVDLVDAEDSAVNFWGENELTCDDEFYVEIAATDGQLYSSQVNADHALTILDNLFMLPAVTTAARVGRIAPPLALTIDFDGNIYRWNMSMNEITAQVNVGEIAMFGKLNQAGTHYMWLPSSQNGLYIAEFETGEIYQIVELDKVYISHMLLTDGADVVIGVDPYDARGTITAWDMASGERLELGDYRTCDRTQPDLVQLSNDGATVIIGCDMGIELWQVVP